MEGLELGAISAIESKDLALFERTMQQLKQFYFSKELRRESKQRQYLQGLHLMYLLVKNKPAEFHTEIELLEFDDLNNKYINLPISVEEFMMDGRYNKVLSLMDKTDKNFGMFLQELENTVRNEIAECLQVIHEHMPVKSAAQILRLANDKALQAYISETQRKWSIEGDKVLFQVASEKKLQINGMDSVKDMLEFTANVETIV